jgi:membrane-associated phospholipid phosphatase
MKPHQNLDSSPEANQRLAPEERQPLSRRGFLGAASGMTAALAAGSVSLSLLIESPETTVRASEIDPLSPAQRRARCLQVRQQAAIFQFNQPLPDHPSNADDAVYINKIASFSKGLPHNNLGEVDQSAYQKLYLALTTGNPADFDAIPLGGSVKLANPQAALAYEMEGADSHHLSVDPHPRFESQHAAGEMAELYWRALTRDVPYSLYGNEALSTAAVNDLKRFSNYDSVTAASLFRGEFAGDQTGPYISQFLLQPYTFGSTPMPQLFRTPFAGNDHMTSYQSWLDIQNGKAPQTAAVWDPQFRYIRNGRDLAEWDHRDFSYQAFLIAALILLGYGGGALDDSNPYKTSPNQGGFSTFGGPHILDLVARVANHALHAVWYQKWSVHRRLRPEEYAGRVHNHLTGAAQYPIFERLLDSPALSMVFSKHGTYLMPQAYPEGCPTHPAFPGGHATIAGACVTVLKAWFKESFVIPNPVVASDDGLSLLPITNQQLTIGGELNKLASNIAFGRDTAGIHYRSDEIAGLKLGEAVALSVLSEFNACFNEKFQGFSLTKFDGTQLLLNAGPGQSARFARSVGRMAR